MIKFRFVVGMAAFVAAAVSVPAVAAVVVDQDAIVSPNVPIGPQAGRIAMSVGNRGSVVNGRAYQTITAGKSGILSGIELQGPFAIGANANQVFMRFSLWDGLLPDVDPFVAEIVQPLASFALGSLNTQATAFFDLSGLGYAVNPGKTFSVLLEAFGPPDGAGLFVIGNVPGLDANGRPVFEYNQYAGGDLYFSVNGGVFGALRGDLGFRTFVDEAAAGVPEPAAWAMLIAGFGIAGVSLRRKSLPQTA